MKPDKFHQQIKRTIEAARSATRQSERLVQALTKVDMDDALRIGEVYRQHAAAQGKLEEELEDMALWTPDAEVRDRGESDEEKANSED